MFVRLAEAYRTIGQRDEARAVLDHGLAETPGHLAGRVLRAKLGCEEGRLGEARRDLAEVLARLPEHHLALQTLALVERTAGDPDAERDALEQVRLVVPEPAVLVRLAELNDESGERPRMPPPRRRATPAMTRPSASVPGAAWEGDPRASTLPEAAAIRPSMSPMQSPPVTVATQGSDPFTNATMAELLASQGDPEGARAMFLALATREPERRSHRERYLELGGAAGALPERDETTEVPAATLERALRDLVEKG